MRKGGYAIFSEVAETFKMKIRDYILKINPTYNGKHFIGFGLIQWIA